MATFHLEINMAGAAFDDPLDGSPVPELQRLLTEVHDRIEVYPDVQTGGLMDVNGNHAGSWWTEEG